MFDGTGPFSGLGMVAWLVGVVMLMAILMSPNGWAWWMDTHSTRGHETGGLVYYNVDGVNYTINDPNSFAGSQSRERTVYYLSSDPSNGSLNNTGNEVIDWGLTAGPGGAGAVLLLLGFARRARRTRRVSSRDPHGSFGDGIPSATIRAIVEQNKPRSA